MIHDPRIIRIDKIIVPINEYMYIKITLPIQQTPTFYILLAMHQVMILDKLPT